MSQSKPIALPKCLRLSSMVPSGIGLPNRSRMRLSSVSDRAMAAARLAGKFRIRWLLVLCRGAKHCDGADGY